MIILFILFFIAILYLFLIKPNTSRKQLMKYYESVFIAHRGLFNNIDIPENTISSFKKAVQNNYGIELDVQITKDNKLVVFHDESLIRMCNKQGIINDYDYDTLKTFKLLNTSENIPLFSDVLKVLKKKILL